MIVTETPLRMSFFGGGTDFREYFENSKYGCGRTLSTTIDMYVYVTVNNRFDDKIRLVYSGNELVDSISDIKHDIIRNALQITGIESGVEIIYSSDIPIAGTGIGLASSSALAVGTLNALHAFKGEFASPAKLAEEACHLEIDMMGQPIGIQDQYAVAYGGFKRYSFNKIGNVGIENVACDKKTIMKLEQHLMLFFTGITRKSGTVLGDQKKNIADRKDQLDSLVESVDDAYQHLATGDIDYWGTALNNAWQTKKQLSGKISNDTIDSMYDAAIKAGALGGKILGAGGGGFLLLYVPTERQQAVKDALNQYRHVPFKFTGQGSQIIFSNER